MTIEAVSAEPIPTEAIEKPARSGPRVVTVLLTIVISVGVVVAALWAVDAWARQQAADYVSDKVRQVLSLPVDEPVTVEIAGLSVIAQVLTGSLDQVSVDVDEVTIGDLTGGVTLTATGVPIDLQQPVDRVAIEFRVAEKDLESIAYLLSAAAVSSVQLVDGEVQFESEFKVFGFGFDIGVGVVPFADEGQIGFTPTSVALNGNRLSAEDLLDRFGSFAEGVLQPRSVCVAQWLPQALTVEEVVVQKKELVLTIGADGRVFTESSLSTLGSCP